MQANKVEVFENIVSKLKTLNLDANEKEVMNSGLQFLKDDMLYLDYNALNNIIAFSKKESDAVKREIQGNVRLYKRSHNDNIRHFLIGYLRSRNPMADLPFTEYVDLG